MAVMAKKNRQLLWSNYPGTHPKRAKRTTISSKVGDRYI